MGLLDDAIREHLELKRRRGADPDEVARQEDEALGDPRSGEFAQPASAASAGPAPEPPEPAPFDDERPAAVVYDPDEDRPAAVVYEPEDEPPAAPAYEPDAEPATAQPDPAASAPAPRDEPWLEEDDRPEPIVGQPTAEFIPPDVEPPREEVVRPDDEPAGDDDVLEETPDFLQETPEHDRLWFEQKPPRDFDFDA